MSKVQVTLTTKNNLSVKAFFSSMNEAHEFLLSAGGVYKSATINEHLENIEAVITKLNGKKGVEAPAAKQQSLYNYKWSERDILLVAQTIFENFHDPKLSRVVAKVLAKQGDNRTRTSMTVRTVTSCMRRYLIDGVTKLISKRTLDILNANGVKSLAGGKETREFLPSTYSFTGNMQEA